MRQADGFSATKGFVVPVSGITIGSNISSLMAQRQLGKSTDALSKSSEKLSSGLRINRASDDAAGLAIATSLNANARIFTVGIRNVNDTLSALGIAEGGISELGSIVTRLKELATQSANGSYSNTQRRALNGEAQSLRQEYNRILQTTEFNDIKLLDGSLSRLQVQAGENATSEQELFVGVGSVTSMNNGTFKGAVAYGGLQVPREIKATDVNGDGKLDLLSAGSGAGGTLQVVLGNGDGTFHAPTSFQAGGPAYSVSMNDVNGDGKLDAILATFTADKVSVLLGNGNGSFKASVSYDAGDDPISLQMADFNGDGKLDIVTAAQTDDTVNILLGNGDGSFKAKASFASGDLNFGVTIFDFNSDGALDLASVSNTDGRINIHLGNGDGSFRARSSYSVSSGSTIAGGDLNGDGIIDLISNGNSTNDSINVLLGNSDGTFKARQTYSAGDNPFGVNLADINSDGILDAITASEADNSINLLIGNGDGSFKLFSQYSVTGDGRTPLIADFDGDTLVDIAVSTYDDNRIHILLGNGNAGLAYFSLATQSEARSALDFFDNVATRVNSALGSIGSQTSRLNIVIANLTQSRENYKAAEARITNADIGEESSVLIRNQILQQSGAAILAQANQSPALALQLLTQQ